MDQLGFLTNDNSIPRPSLLPKSSFSEPIKMVAVGMSHSLVLTVSGQLYVWGDNRGGQLGLGDKDERSTPTFLPLQSEPIKMISVGSHHNLALTASGQIYVWGYNGDGQLGLGDTITRLTPTLLSSELFRNDPSNNIKAVIAGEYNSFVLTVTGKLYVWGDNDRGQLGLGDIIDHPTPTPMLLSPKVVPKPIGMVSVGNSNFTALTASGQVYFSGVDFVYYSANNVDILTRVQFKSFHQPIMRIAAGSRHRLFLTVSGQIYAWGSNDFRQLGLGNTENTATPIQIQSSDTFKMVEVGLYYSFALTVSGLLYVWGANTIDHPTPTILQMP
jgi:alpha-tubulin suppressor-like RCC1 family protein